MKFFFILISTNKKIKKFITLKKFMLALLKIIQSYLISFNLFFFLSIFYLLKNKYFFLKKILSEKLLIIKLRIFF